MTQAFITIRFLDVLDVLLMAFLLYKLYQTIRGTAAFNIVMGIFIFYLTWVVIRGLKMELMGTIMGQIIAAGVLVIVVVFQQEIRKMFLLLGSRYNFLNKAFSFDTLFSRESAEISNEQVKQLVQACELMSRTKTGALIVLTNKVELNDYIETGERIEAELSIPLLETIFFKNSPLHDGAVIVKGGTIKAARCLLPVNKRKIKNNKLGLRHRAAIGMSQATDAQVLIVSEETGNISYAYNGKLKENVNPIELPKLVESGFRD